MRNGSTDDPLLGELLGFDCAAVSSPSCLLLLRIKVVKVLVARSCPALCDPMDCSLPDSSVPEILQGRMPQWVAILFSRGPS